MKDSLHCVNNLLSFSVLVLLGYWLRIMDSIVLPLHFSIPTIPAIFIYIFFSYCCFFVNLYYTWCFGTRGGCWKLRYVMFIKRRFISSLPYYI